MLKISKTMRDLKAAKYRTYPLEFPLDVLQVS